MRPLRVNKTDITTENAFNRNHFGIEGNHESNNDEKNLFWVFWRFVTRALTLRPRKKYIYVLQTLFGFGNF